LAGSLDDEPEDPEESDELFSFESLLVPLVSEEEEADEAESDFADDPSDSELGFSVTGDPFDFFESRLSVL
jgi:hypothetical protein